MLSTFDLFSDLPEDTKNVIIYFSKCKVYDLCLVDKYFNNNSKKIKILSNKRYPKLLDKHLKEVSNLKSLHLNDEVLFTNEGSKKLKNLTYLIINYKLMIIIFQK